MFLGISFCGQFTCAVPKILCKPKQLASLIIQLQTCWKTLPITLIADTEKKVFDNFDDFILYLVSVQPRISLNPGPRYAIEGSTFTLPTCHVTGYPTPVVTWRKLSSQLPQGRVRYNNSALQISQVRKEDSDTYTCSAKNLLGKAEKNTLFVVVSLPRFTSNLLPRLCRC